MSSSTWWPLLWERLLIGSRQGVIFGGGGRDRVPGAGRRRRNCLGRPGLGRCGPLAGYWTGGLSVCVGCLLSLLGPGRGRLGWRSERLLRWHGLRFGPVWVGRRDFCLFFFFFFFSRFLSLSLVGFGRECAGPASPRSLFGGRRPGLVLMAMPGVLRWWVALACSPPAPRSRSLGMVVPASRLCLRQRGSTSCP